jgi:hypothetical protein
MFIPHNLPFRLQTNVANQAYSGPVKLSFEFDLYSEETAKPFFFSATIWSRAANAQFFTTASRGNTKIDLVSIDQQHNALTLSLRCENTEPAAWLSLLCQLAQVSHHTTALRLITLELSSFPSSNEESWFDPAKQELYSLTNIPNLLTEAQKSLLPGQSICVDIEFARDLNAQEFSSIEKELELWGCLLATGGLRIDFTPVEKPLHTLSFGTTSQLTPSWIRYIKQEFDGPVEAVALLDHWLGGLWRRGISTTAVELS